MTVQPKADQPSPEIGADQGSLTIKEQGPRSQRLRIKRIEKGKKKILTGISVPLDMAYNG